MLRQQEEIRTNTTAGQTPKPLTPKNRGRIDMIVDVLQACNPGMVKSHVMLRANLNSIVATYLLSHLMSRKLIRTNVEDGSTFYYTTVLGLDFLRKYGELSSILADEPNQGRLNDLGAAGMIF